MKKLLSILFLSTFAFVSCSDDGEIGPRGPQGPPGEDGAYVVGISYEYDVEFQYDEESNIYTSLLEFPQTEEPSDAILVYRLETINNIDTWNLIPKSYFLDEGILQISYNHTDEDVQLLIEADFDINDLNSSFTQDQYYRVVVLPSDFEQGSVDTSNMHAVLDALNLQENEIIKIKNSK
ncbi:hypothetical protein [Autumnicola psychrophila]|uniref:Collagen-like protein n=1 Tax=Autumnicola psychrophila TaxID=3075592 RepID=A0ABU3DQ23_9FLAO|nr:hypothetical protein [Zunongwangia sp. F225]MDT0685811.1 hypothetical protein [Zunongwangia sp. F225]